MEGDRYRRDNSRSGARQLLWTGTLSALLGGVAVVCIQSLGSFIGNIDARELSIDQTPKEISFPIGKVFNMGDSDKTGVLKNIEITNTGHDDLANVSISSVTNSIKIYNVTEFPLKNPQNASISYDGKVLTVLFRYIPAGGKLSFWVMMTNSAIGSKIDFLKDGPGIELINKSSDDRSRVQLFVFIGAGVTAFITVSMLSFGLITIRLSRNSLRASQIELRDAVLKLLHQRQGSPISGNENPENRVP